MTIVKGIILHSGTEILKYFERTWHLTSGLYHCCLFLKFLNNVIWDITSIIVTKEIVLLLPLKRNLINLKEICNRWHKVFMSKCSNNETLNYFWEKLVITIGLKMCSNLSKDFHRAIRNQTKIAFREPKNKNIEIFRKFDFTQFFN